MTSEVSPAGTRTDVASSEHTAQLLSGIAHEIRNALFTTRMTLDALEVSRPAADELPPLLESLRRQLDPLQDLAADLAFYNDPPTAERDNASFATLLQAAAERCVDPRPWQGSPVQLPEHAVRTRVHVEQSSMLRALTHLLTYAVRRSSLDQPVRPLLSDADAAIECTIEDNGSPILDEDLTHLFEPFLPRSRGGFDMRLAAARRIIEANGGALRAEHGSNGGVRLVLWLPCASSTNGRPDHTA